MPNRPERRWKATSKNRQMRLLVVPRCIRVARFMAVIACTNPGESPRRLSARNDVLFAEVRVGNVLDPLPQLPPLHGYGHGHGHAAGREGGHSQACECDGCWVLKTLVIPAAQNVPDDVPPLLIHHAEKSTHRADYTHGLSHTILTGSPREPRRTAHRASAASFRQMSVAAKATAPW